MHMLMINIKTLETNTHTYVCAYKSANNRKTERNKQNESAHKDGKCR